MLEEQLAELLEGTTDAAFVVDLQGEVQTWNRAAEKLFGYPPSFAIGKSCAALLASTNATHSAVCREYCDILECVRKGLDVSNFDMEVRNRSEQNLWVNVSVIVAADNRTKRRLTIHLMRDVRERKNVEKLSNTVLQLARDLINGVGSPENAPPVSPLTVQEKRILRRLASGDTTHDISAELHISQRTLRNHIYHINQKLHTKSRLEAVAQARKRGLI
jgi:PAS domain S-box-containing protein